LRVTGDGSPYESPIDRKSWDRLLDSWFEEEEKRQDKNRNVRETDELFLRYVYAYKLTAFQNMSPTQVFDIEHIVPVQALQDLRKSTEKDGLPMNAVANLALLDTKINKPKQDRTIYEFYDLQVERGNMSQEDADAAVKSIEQLLLTSRDQVPSTKDLSESTYSSFLEKRWPRLKEAFYTACGIRDSAS
jgi:hypothetical protein